MSLRPIDLQTMFMRMGDLSREQAAAQDAHAKTLASQDARMAKLAKDQDKKVSELGEVPEGPEKVKDDEEQAPRQETQDNGEPASPEAMVEDSGPPAKALASRNNYLESYKGTHIDIQG